jgi:hypothetical protein
MQPPQPTDSPRPVEPQTPTPRPRRRRRHVRWTLGSVLAVALVVTVGLAVVSRPVFLKAFLLPYIGDRLNCDADARSIGVSSSGVFRLTGVSLRVEDVDGPASEFLSAPEIRVRAHPLRALWGGEAIESITLVRPVIRISQSEDLRVNVADVFRSTHGAGASRVPNIAIEDATLEVGEHDGGSYAPLLSVRVDGGLDERLRVNGLYSVLLIENRAVAEAEDRPPMVVDGEVDINLGVADLAIENIDLSSLTKRGRGKATERQEFQGFWSRLGIWGLIPEATVTYERESRLDVSFTLDDVDVSIPLPTRVLVDQKKTVLSDEKLLDMTGVSGAVTFNQEGLEAELRGSLEDLDVEVTLETEGLAVHAPFNAVIDIDRFELTEEPPLLPFAPPVAHKVFRQFSSPTAKLDGSVTVWRPPGGGPDDIEFSGVVNLTNGEARYEQFPYPILDISAVFEFDRERFRVLKLSGVGPEYPDGERATLFATGVIEPPGNEASVDLDVSVSKIALDHRFREALPESRRAVFDTLFHGPSQSRLVASGLVIEPAEVRTIDARMLEIRRRLGAADLDPAERAALEAERGELDRRLELPRFALGGLARLNVHVYRPPGLDRRYEPTIVLRAEEAGLLLEAFPFPARARDVEITLAEGRATLEPTRLVGLDGGVGEIEGRVVYERGRVPVPVEPDLRLHAEGVPVGPYLLGALPALRPTERFDPEAFVEDLGLSGTLDLSADITPSDAGGLAYAVAVDLEGLVAEPALGRIEVGRLRGGLRVSNNAIRVEGLGGSIGEGSFTIAVEAERAGVDDGWTIRGAASATDLPLETPIEDIVEHFGRERAQRLAEYRARFDPAGVADARIDFEIAPDDLSYLVTFDALRDVSFDTPHGRSTMTTSGGRLALRPDALSFQDLTAELGDGPGSGGRVSVSGTYPYGEGAGEPDLDLSIERGRLESPVIRWALTSLAPRTEGLVDSLDPRGAFHLDLRVDPPRPGEDDPRLAWTCRPLTLTVARRGVDVDLEQINGELRSDGPGTILVDQLEAISPNWSVRLDGRVLRGPEPTLEAELSLDARRVDEQLLAALPRQAGEAMSAIELSIDGGRCRLDGARVRYTPGAGGVPTRLTVTGVARHTGVSLNAGVPVAHLDGYTRLDLDLGAPGSDPSMTIDVHADAFTIAGATATRGHARFRSSAEPGDIILQALEADVHRGRLTGRARFADAIDLGVSAPGPGYEFHAELSGVDFAALVADLKDDDDGGGDASSPDPPPASAPAFGQGRLDAQLSVSGAVRDPEVKRGRCSARVQDGDVLNMPGVVPILEIANLHPPVGEQVDLAFADLFLDGSLLRVDQLALYSSSVRIAGMGDVSLPGLGLDLDVEARGVRHVPVLSQFFEALSDEIASIRVTGTIADPEFRLEQLSSTRRLLGVILGDDAEGD